MAEKMAYVGDYSMCIWEECVFLLLWVECRINVSSVKLCSCSINFLREILKSPSIIVDLSISTFSAITFCLTCVGAFV